MRKKTLFDQAKMVFMIVLFSSLIGVSCFSELEDQPIEKNELKPTGLSAISFVVVDIETTGGSHSTDRITEIGAFALKNRSISHSMTSLINPQREIPSLNTQITGIDDELVRNSPTIESILPHFIKIFGDNVLVAHNASFHFRFINAELERSEMPPLENNIVCTLKLSRRVFSGEQKHDLDYLIKKFNIELNPISERHRSYGDAWAAAKILIECLNILEKAGMTSLDELLEFQNMQIDKARKKYNLL